MAASCLLDLGIHNDLDSVFALAAEVEGHPDNAAAAVFGGFTIASPDGSFVRRLRAHDELRPVVLVPDVRMSTERARLALADTVMRRDAVFNSAHAALTVVALTQDPVLLPVALQDRLHESARLALVPEVKEVFDELRAAGVGVCVSGAGPSLLAFEREGATLDELELALVPQWRVLRPPVRERGVEVVQT